MYIHRQFIYLQMTVLYRKIQNEADSKLLQEDMSNLLRCESDWQMEFHQVNASFYVSPTNVSHLPQVMTYTDPAKYLGVTIHKTINWNTFIENITKKTNSTRAFIQRNLQHCPQRTKAVCYTTLVRPIAWVRMYSLGPIYQRQHPESRKCTKTIGPVCNERLSTNQ